MRECWGIKDKVRSQDQIDYRLDLVDLDWEKIIVTHKGHTSSIKSNKSSISNKHTTQGTDVEQVSSESCHGGGWK